MIQLKHYPCNSKRELELEERKYFEELKATLNTQFPSRNQKQRYQDNKEKIAEQQKQYHQNNKGKIKQYNKQYHQKNKERLNEKLECECGGRYTYQHKSQHHKTKKHLLYMGKK
jgi:adenylate kinase family enzyme